MPQSGAGDRADVSVSVLAVVRVARFGAVAALEPVRDAIAAAPAPRSEDPFVRVGPAREPGDAGVVLAGRPVAQVDRLCRVPVLDARQSDGLDPRAREQPDAIAEHHGRQVDVMAGSGTVSSGWCVSTKIGPLHAPP